MTPVPRLARDFPAPLEDAEQRAVMAWATQQAALMPARFGGLALLYHVPNGGRRDPIVAAKLKAAGVRAGVPDLVLPIARQGCHSLYVEMKRIRGGTVTATQQWWHDRLRAEGHRVEVAKGFHAARAILLDYLTR